MMPKLPASSNSQQQQRPRIGILSVGSSEAPPKSGDGIRCECVVRQLQNQSLCRSGSSADIPREEGQPGITSMPTTGRHTIQNMWYRLGYVLRKPCASSCGFRTITA